MPRQQQKHRADRVLVDVEWTTVSRDNLAGLLLEHFDFQLRMIEKLSVPVFCTLNRKGVAAICRGGSVWCCSAVNIKATLARAQTGKYGLDNRKVKLATRYDSR